MATNSRKARKKKERKKERKKRERGAVCTICTVGWALINKRSAALISAHRIRSTLASHFFPAPSDEGPGTRERPRCSRSAGWSSDQLPYTSILEQHTNLSSFAKSLAARRAERDTFCWPRSPGRLDFARSLALLHNGSRARLSLFLSLTFRTSHQRFVVLCTNLESGGKIWTPVLK